MVIDSSVMYLLPMILVAAMLYSAVGHGGASGYLAAMALFGLDPAVMKPAALTMNIFVSTLVLARLAWAGYFNWRLFVPLAVGSVPLAFLGGTLLLDSASYKVLVGIALLLGAGHFMWHCQEDNYSTHPPRILLVVAVGAILGLLSGLTGVGGGIFLSPIVLLLHWTQMRGSAAIAAAFILLNSIAGLAGHAVSVNTWPDNIPVLVMAAFVGALIGSELGVRRIAPAGLRTLLGFVLAIAATKMIVTA